MFFVAALVICLIKEISIVCEYQSKSKYEVERVRYPENDDAMTSYVLSYWVSASSGFLERGSVLLLAYTIFLL